MTTTLPAPRRAAIGTIGTAVSVVGVNALDVPPALRWWVDGVVVDFDIGTAQPLVHLPDAGTTLVYRITSDGRAGLVVVGPRTHATFYEGKHLPLCVRIRLRPGVVRPLFGVSTSALVDRVIPLRAFWPETAELERRPGDDPESVLARIATVLGARTGALSTADVADGVLLRTAVDALAGLRRERLPDLARRLAVSERHLRNVFHRGLGLPPSRLARIERVRHILAERKSQPWAYVAATAGYYDQSHMIAEFRTLMGVTPAAYFADRLPPLQACANSRGTACIGPDPDSWS
jgi:AraC-like DNA-binding protein